MFELLALLLGMVLAAWSAWLLIARGKRQLDAAVAYRTVAGNLGLDGDTRGVSISGHLGKRRLWVGEVMVGHGPDRRFAIWGVVDLTRPLALGLQLRRRGLSERVFRRRKAPSIELGSDLDRRIELSGDHPERVRALLDRDTRTALLALMDRWPDVVVTDGNVRVHLARPLVSERALGELVERMVALAAALERARTRIEPPDGLLKHCAPWRRVADDLGLAFEGSLPAIVGERDGRTLVVAVRRAQGGYEGELRLYFREHVPIGFRVRPQVAPDGYWSVGQDIQVGRDDVDRAFVVKGWDPERVRTLLAGPPGDALLAALETGRVQADDIRLHVSGIALEEDSVRRAIGAAFEVADALGW